MLQTWNLLVYVARLRKKNIILWRTLAKIVEKIKLTKLKYLITEWLHSNNPLQRKHARRKLVFTVAILLKGNRSSFSKQLGINCTCEQIGLLLISTRGCGSHSWKLLKSPICSRVQLIPNCFSNRPISYIKCMHTTSQQYLIKLSIDDTRIFFVIEVIYWFFRLNLSLTSLVCYTVILKILKLRPQFVLHEKTTGL